MLARHVLKEALSLELLLLLPLLLSPAVMSAASRAATCVGKYTCWDSGAGVLAALLLLLLALLGVLIKPCRKFSSCPAAGFCTSSCCVVVQAALALAAALKLPYCQLRSQVILECLALLLVERCSWQSSQLCPV
jgi:hypothetical protein